MLAMDTSSLETIAALATDIFKAVCLSESKAAFGMGIDSTILTTNILFGVGDGCGEGCRGSLTQAVFEFAPICVETVPGSHAIQSDSWLPPAIGRYFPAAQPLQAATSLAARVLEYLPGIQATQASDAFAPDLLEYFPVGQSMHASDEFDPG